MIKTSILIATIILLGISLNSGFAADIIVDNSTDGGGIQKGIINAANQDTIILAPGNYIGTNNTGITISKNVTIQGNGPTASVIIDAQGQNRIFNMSNNLNVTFINITFTNGRNSTGPGGAIYNSRYATMTFINCTFTNNNATAGGAIYNNGINLRVIGSIFINNTGTSGGAIYNSGVTISVNNSNFTNNTATIYGGVIYNTGAKLSVSGSNFTNNHANRGGVIYNTGANLGVSGSNFTNNKANTTGGAIYNTGDNFSVGGSIFINNTGTSGGAIYNSEGDNLSVSGSNFTNNTGTTGGAIYNTGDNSSVSGSIFINNTGTSGGAIYSYGVFNFTVSGSIFINNSATATGGAIYIQGGNSSVSGSNFTNNNASSGGAIYISNINGIVSGSNFINNTAYNLVSGSGGGVYSSGNNSRILDSNFTGNSHAVGLANINFTLSNNRIINNSVGIQFILANLNYTIVGLNNTNVIIDNLYAVAISGNNANYTVIDSFGSNNNGGFIFINRATGNRLTGNFTGYNMSDDRGVAVMFNVTSTNNLVYNSTINGNDVGVVFNGTNNTLTGSNIFNNLKGGIIVYNVAGNRINYNRIYNNNGTGFDMINLGTSTNADLNWWGKNNISGLISSLNTNNHYILNITNTSSLDNVHIGDNVTFYLLVLNTTFNNTNVTNLPYFVINGTFNGVAYNSSRDDLFIYDFNILSGETQKVDASLDDEYVYITFDVIKYSTNSTIVVSPNPVQIDDNITVSGQLTNYTGITGVNVTVDGTKFNVNVTNGYWELNYTTNPTGNLTVVVSFVGNENYTAFTNTTNFTVNKGSTNSTIVVSPNPVSIGENVTVSGVLANHTGISSVTVIVDGNTQLVAVNNGVWSRNYTTIRTGSISVVVSFAGNENYTSFSNFTTFSVASNSTNSTIVVSPNPVQIGENVTVSGVLANYTGVTQVNVTVDGSTQVVAVNSITGVWSRNYTTNRTGSIGVVVSFAGNENYTSFINSTTFTVASNSTNSTIIVNPNPVSIGNNITISGHLANHTGLTSVNVTVDGSTQVVSVNNTGDWALNYTTNRTGTFDIVVSFAGDGNYDAFSNSTTFTVNTANKNSTNSTIVVNPNPVNIGENITVSGQLANYTGITSVNVTINGKLFTVGVDGSGYWVLNYTTNRTGNLTVVVSFAGNDHYTSFTNATSFNVSKLSVKSTVNVLGTVKVGKTMKIDGVLVDENGKPVANAPVTVAVDGKVYHLTTDSNGRWSLTYKPTHTGTIDITLNYTGNNEYSRYANTTTFNVIKGEAIVDTNVVKNPDGSVDVIITVTDEDGDPVPDYKVSVDLDGKHIGDIVTDAEGVGRIHISSSKLNDGKHVITVSSDDVNYNANPVSAAFETQNNDNDNNETNDTNNTNKTTNNLVASATMKNTGMPIIAIVLVLLTIFGINIRRKQD
jgi:polymorphic membrane protein